MGCREGIDPADFEGGVDSGDEEPTALISITDADASQDPDGSIWCRFTIYVNNIDFVNEVSAQYSTANGTATAGTHYLSQFGRTAVLPVGTSSVQIAVQILNPEGSGFTGRKTFTVTLFSPDNADLGGATGTGTIDYDDLGSTDTPPSFDFPRMTMWWPYWSSRSQAQVAAIADDMVYMHQTGVVLMGMDWGSDYQLPSDVSDKLDIFIARGIRPYLGLWVGHLDEDDQNTALEAINAGDGKWAGIVLDAENQWVQHVVDVGDVAAKADFDEFMALVRPRTSFLGAVTYASPTSFPNYHYSWWNEQIDYFIPAAFFDSSSDSGDNVINTMYSKFKQAYNNQGWSEPPKPIIPLMNGYNADLTNAQVGERAEYMDIAFAKSGVIGIWRWIDDFPDNMRALLHSTPAYPPSDNNDAQYTGWSEDNRVTYDEFIGCAYDAACTGYAGAALMSGLYSAQNLGKARFNPKKLYEDAGGPLCLDAHGNCDHSNCAGGYSPATVLNWMHSHGVQRIDDNPTNIGGTNYSCKYRDVTDDHAMYAIASPIALGGTGVTQAQLITKIKQAIKDTGVAAMASVFYSNWNNCRSADNYVLRPHANEDSSIAHMWVLLGWDDDYLLPNSSSVFGSLAGKRVGCFRIQSSHGCDWGQNGRGWIPYSYLSPLWLTSPRPRFKYWRVEWSGAV